MTIGDVVKIAGTWYPITDHQLWRSSGSEEEYFRILRDRQKRGSDYVPPPIPENQQQVQTPGTLF
jgi:hypothetical protein